MLKNFTDKNSDTNSTNSIMFPKYMFSVLLTSFIFYINSVTVVASEHGIVPAIPVHLTKRLFEAALTDITCLDWPAAHSPMYFWDLFLEDIRSWECIDDGQRKDYFHGPDSFVITNECGRRKCFKKKHIMSSVQALWLASTGECKGEGAMGYEIGERGVHFYLYSQPWSRNAPKTEDQMLTVSEDSKVSVTQHHEDMQHNQEPGISQQRYGQRGQRQQYRQPEVPQQRYQEPQLQQQYWNPDVVQQQYQEQQKQYLEPDNSQQKYQEPQQQYWQPEVSRQQFQEPDTSQQQYQEPQQPHWEPDTSHQQYQEPQQPHWEPNAFPQQYRGSNVAQNHITTNENYYLAPDVVEQQFWEPDVPEQIYQQAQQLFQEKEQGYQQYLAEQQYQQPEQQYPQY
ncbi:hypothetical protein EV426DRAFT_674582 [Tirmania nivea]|nr:hypothetical protein EV426DRAFT_674582 [Tirmania nivea]